MKNYTLINKKFTLSEDAKISISERACKFGDGVFETCKIYNSKIYDFQSHLKRLKKGLKALQIFFDTENLEDDLYKLIKKNKIEEGILRFSVTRGVGSMGYLPADDISPLLIAETFSKKEVRRKKIRLGISKIKVAKKQNFLKNCKLMQSVEYILAKIEARKLGNFDDVMLSSEGYISETSSSNIFFVKGDKIYTPDQSCDALCGTIREKIIKKYPKKVNLCKSLPSRLENIDEIFITNSNLLALGVDEILISGKVKKLKKKISEDIFKFLLNDLKKECAN